MAVQDHSWSSISMSVSDYILKHNKFCLVYKGSEDIAAEGSQNRHFRWLLSFDAPLQRTPANIRINLTLTETTFPGLHFLQLIVWVYLHSTLCGVFFFKTHACNATESIAVHGYPRSWNSVPLLKARMWLPISDRETFAPFRRYGDLDVDNLIWHPCSGWPLRISGRTGSGKI